MKKLTHLLIICGVFATMTSVASLRDTGELKKASKSELVKSPVSIDLSIDVVSDLAFYSDSTVAVADGVAIVTTIKNAKVAIVLKANSTDPVLASPERFSNKDTKVDTEKTKSFDLAFIANERWCYHKLISHFKYPIPTSITEKDYCINRYITNFSPIRC